jgi:hypothetical protein
MAARATAARVRRVGTKMETGVCMGTASWLRPRT